MACRTKRNQILLGIGPGLAAKLFVVNLEIGHRAAGLASPAVAAEHVSAEMVVQLGIEARRARKSSNEASLSTRQYCPARTSHR